VKSGSPDCEILLDRVAEIFPLLDETAAQSEQLRRLCPQAVEALHEKGLFRLWVPVECGGYNVDLATQVDVMIAVARADMSACWTMMIGNSVISIMASGLPDEGLAEVFSQAQLPVAAGSLKASGEAREVEAGYAVNGHWRFGSGIQHARYIVANCRLADSKQNLSLTIPITEVTIHDDWYVAGLSGSGSNSYSVSDVFVPHSRVLSSKPLRGNMVDPMSRLPIEHASVSLGGARRAIDEVTLQAVSKYRLGESLTVASKQSFQTELGRLQAEWESLYAGVKQGANKMARIGQGDPGAFKNAAIKLRAVCAHAAERSLAIGGKALRQAGAAAVANDNVLQRIFRDLTVSAQHAMIGDVAYEDSGKAQLATRHHNLGLQSSGERKSE